MPTITTVDQHLNKILPYFELSLRNFGHFKFNHMNQKDRKSAYLFLKNICGKRKSVLIYPSGSIYTPIDKRFSKSISKLSIANNLNVIAWKLHYKNISKKEKSYNGDVFGFIVNRFFSEKIEFNVKKVKVFSPKDYLTEKEYHEKVKSFYLS